MEQTFDIALTLHAEHELNASTFAARVTAATLSDIYSSITSGIGALRGPLHGGANEEVIRLLLEDAITPTKALAMVKDKLDNKIKIPGFGHRVYHTTDPRAASLKGMAKDLGERTGHQKLYEISTQIETVHQGEQEAERERRFLLRLHLLFAGHSRRSVHADFRGEPHVRLDGARARAVQQQPADPSARGLYGRRSRARSGFRSRSGRISRLVKTGDRRTVPVFVYVRSLIFPAESRRHRHTAGGPRVHARRRNVPHTRRGTARGFHRIRTD